MIALLFLQLAATQPALRPIYHGRQGATAIHAPASATEAVIDGRLDEPQWRSAALLTGFSLYQPVDGIAAPDSTEVLLWHSASALYVGIRAYEPHGDARTTVHATLADRDKISGDDNVQLLLDTFDDKHRAFVFGVNPLGVQSDGIRSEGSGAGSAGGAPGQVDLSSDFIYESSGHVTDYGYEVELRIPFAALRYPPGASQRWGINVIRTVQHSGYTETWTPVRRASASFLSQSGVLTGLEGIGRGRVLLLNPELTARATGGPNAMNASGVSGAWGYRGAQDLGGNVKFDVNSALTLNGTIHPDFSQVEADAAQLATDQRFALFFPEKRPFFIDGIEQFDVPNRLVYTRRIAQPIGATKLTGTLAGTDLALLAAEDSRRASANGTQAPVYVIARLRRDIAAGRATVGLVYTDREDGADVNRVLGADARVLFGGLYYAQFQAVGSQTRHEGSTVMAPLWEATVDRTGRNFGFHYVLTGIDEGFVAGSGFVARTGYVRPLIANRFTVYGKPGAALENFTTRVTLDGFWKYRDFFRGQPVLEDHASSENNFTFRGGWSLTVTPLVATVAFDPAAYVNYAVSRVRDTTAFVLPARQHTLGLRGSIATPQFRHVAASVSAQVGSDVDFFEADVVQRRDATATVDWRPTRQLRVAASYLSSTLLRESDGVRVARARIPRLKTEYQLSRPIFVRLVGQYDARSREALLDYRTGLPLVVGGPASFRGAGATASNGLRIDGLFSYQPSPGTVLFVGYGNSLTEPDALALTRLRRVSDGFFAKVSYLFRS